MLKNIPRTTLGSYERTIHGKDIFVFFNWSNYSPSDYRKDFEAYKKYLEEFYKPHPNDLAGLKTSIKSFPDNQDFLEALEQEIEFDLAKHPSEFQNHQLIVFAEFRAVTEDKVKNIIFDLFMQDPALMPPNEKFSVDITVEPVKDRDWYFMHFFNKEKYMEKMDKQRMFYKISGYWLLHNIVIPACHLKDEQGHHEDAKVSLLQQLKEHQDALEKNLIDDTKLGAELKKYLKEGDSRNVKYLYYSVHGVWASVLSEFYAVYNAKHYVTIPAGAIHNYRRLLDILTQQSQINVKSFYEEHIGYQNTGHAGDISMGRIVGLIATCAAAESAFIKNKNKRKKPYDIFVNGKIVDKNSLKDRQNFINAAISDGMEISIGNFDQTIVNAVLADIRREKDLNEFIKYVEGCFNAMNISKQNQIYNQEMFDALITAANSRKK